MLTPRNHAFTGFTSGSPGAFVIASRRVAVCFADGSHVASHACIAVSAFCWTARIVASTVPEDVMRSEQWNPSPIAMGCSDVLWRMWKSEETVASRHGSPTFLRFPVSLVDWIECEETETYAVR